MALSFKQSPLSLSSPQASVRSPYPPSRPVAIIRPKSLLNPTPTFLSFTTTSHKRLARCSARGRFAVYAAGEPTPEEQSRIEAMKAEYEAAMADPEQAEQVKAIQERMSSAMQSPEAQAQMNAMGSFMKNPEVQKKIEELKDDPEFKEFFDTIKKEGAGGIMKFWNDPDMLKKIGEKLGPVAAATDPNAQAAQKPPEIETLLDAARYGDLEAAEDLLAVGKDANMQDDVGRTPLHYCVAYDKLEVMEELLQADGINVNLQDEKDNTPLHYAAGYGRLACMQALLNAGADVSITNATGKTALDLATADQRNPVSQDAELCKRLKASAFTDQV